MKNIIENYKDIVVQILTPGGSGSGFLIKDKNIIVTNRHVVAGNKEVVVRGEGFEKTLTNIIYTDALNDLAFVKIPEVFNGNDVKLASSLPSAGESIIAIGHPLGLRFTATQGIISKSDRKFNNIDYLQVDAAINPGNSGGPLINEKGEIIGVNTFIYRDGESLGFALPSVKLLEVIESYQDFNGETSAKCPSCTNIVKVIEVEDDYCPQCGNKFPENELNPLPYQPTGVSQIIENILTALNKDVKLSRVGKSSWDIKQGSALIKITYNTQNKFIYCDATLGTLPKQNIGDIYEFMLKENHNLENLAFSVNQQNIVLGTIIFDGDLNEETGKIIFEELFQKADYYDNVLEEKFGMEMAEMN